jgi:hypothetical protein
MTGKCMTERGKVMEAEDTAEAQRARIEAF